MEALRRKDPSEMETLMALQYACCTYPGACPSLGLQLVGWEGKFRHGRRLADNKATSSGFRRARLPSGSRILVSTAAQCSTVTLFLLACIPERTTWALAKRVSCAFLSPTYRPMSQDNVTCLMSASRAPAFPSTSARILSLLLLTFLLLENTPS